jgi:hypothetical protein
MLEDLDVEFEKKVSREDLEDFCSEEELDQLFQRHIATTNSEQKSS